jgi:hypothetical protein
MSPSHANDYGSNGGADGAASIVGMHADASAPPA